MTATTSGKKSVHPCDLKRDDTLADHICAAYRIADSAMRDFSFYNATIDIDAVGFYADDDACTGIAVTPWGMMIVRALNTTRPPHPDGESVTRHYPSGDYDFVTGHLDGVGAVETCPLFSSMSCFSCPSDACEAAQNALSALFEPPAALSATKPEPLSRRALLGKVMP